MKTWGTDLKKIAVAILPFFVVLFPYHGVSLFGWSGSLNVTAMMRADHLLLGVVPGAWLQDNLWGHWYTGLLDIITNAAYISYFAVPIVGWWLLPGAVCRRALWGWVIVQLLGYVGYVLFPAIPPWIASSWGYPVGTAEHFFMTPERMLQGSNPYAAVPSLHIAVPFYWALWLLFARRSRWPMLWVVLIGFSAAYLGHHYLFDMIAGVALGGSVFLIVVIQRNVNWPRVSVLKPRRLEGGLAIRG